ncbi:MAG: CDP-diacylglycerol--serine O-phosphatidyltransferase [Bacteroidales bacterium]|nr:CDP-diacylglycerol--serine O-phosphatidyltransferase [Bacteroidales bacterium]
MSPVRHIPNTITSLNLLSGVLGVICAVSGKPECALLFMLAAAVFDFCDGLAARLLKAYSPIGAQLDSLADMVSFGVLPALMLMNCMQSHDAVSWLCFAPLFIAVMSAVRLAKFNIDTRQTTNFLGLPTPANALLCASLAAFVAEKPQFFLADWAGSLAFIPGLSLILGLLLVSEIPMFGMKVAPGHKLLDTKRIVFLILAVTSAVCALVIWKSWILAILLIFSIYLFENLIVSLLPAKK